MVQIQRIHKRWKRGVSHPPTQKKSERKAQNEKRVVFPFFDVFFILERTMTVCRYSTTRVTVNAVQYKKQKVTKMTSSHRSVVKSESGYDTTLR